MATANDSTRTKIMRIRVSDAEREQIHKNAGGAGNVSPWLRALALQQQPLPAPRQRARVKPPHVAPELVRELARLGSNVNQLARAANEQRKSGFDFDTAEVLQQLSRLSNELEAIRREYTR